MDNRYVTLYVTSAMLFIGVEALQNVSLETNRTRIRIEPDVIPYQTWNSCINYCQAPMLMFFDCACDEDCLFYGDCCRDYLYYCSDVDETRNKTLVSSFNQQLQVSADHTKPRWSCVGDHESVQLPSDGVLVVVTCPPSWSSTDIKRKCEWKGREVVKEKLVYDSRGYVYANQFCAICNNITNIDSNNSTLENDPTSCGKSNCSTEFSVEDVSKNAIQLRLCLLHVIDNCPLYTTEELLFGCSAYTEYVFDGQNTYKNYMCEDCNPYQPFIDFDLGLDSLIPTIGTETGDIFSGNDPPPIREIFRVPFYKPTPHNVVEKVTCNQNEYYDATTEKCQQCENGTIVAENEYLSALNNTGLRITLLNRVSPSPDYSKESGSVVSESNDIDKEVAVGGEDKDHEVKDKETSVCITSCNVIADDVKLDEVDGWVTLNTNGSKLSCRVLKNTLVINVMSESEDIFSYSKIMTFVNLVVCVISLVALLVSILTLSCFPSLLNLPGICRLCLMISLFLAQLIMLTIAYVPEPEQLCIATAAVMHFFWLAMFCWTNVLAFDLARVFGNKSSRPNRAGSTSKKRRLLCSYMLYGWGLPLAIVTSCLALQFSGKFDFSYGGNSFCWFSNSHSLVFAFGIPVSICIGLNFILYIVTVIGIWKVRRVTEFAISQNDRAKKRKDELKTYIKLSILMGVTWGLVFITVYTDKEIFWYIFIILNGLQGFFIFIAFTCNRQTLATWQGAYRTHVGSHLSSKQSKTTSLE